MYAQIHDAPATPDMHHRVLELLGDGPFPGLVTHVALQRPEGGLRFVDVWESREAFEAFRDAHLSPAVNQMLAEHGIPADQGDGPQGPDHAPTDVYGVVEVLIGTGAITVGGAARPS
jgi:hypothetical protein